MALRRETDAYADPYSGIAQSFQTDRWRMVHLVRMIVICPVQIVELIADYGLAFVTAAPVEAVRCCNIERLSDEFNKRKSHMHVT